MPNNRFSLFAFTALLAAALPGAHAEADQAQTPAAPTTTSVGSSHSAPQRSCCSLVEVIPKPEIKSSGKIEPTNHLQSAREYLEAQDYTNAYVEAQAAVSRAPRDYLSHYYLGAALVALLDFPEAGREFQECINIQPDAADAHFMLAQTYRLRRMYNEAINEYKESLRYQPDKALPHAYLAECHRMQGADWSVSSECARASALDDKTPLPNTILGQWYLGQGKVESALAEYDKAIVKAPNDPYVHFRFGQSLGELQKWTQAESEFRKSIELGGSRYADGKLGLSWALANQKKFSEAVKAGKEAVASAPTDVEAHLSLAGIYKQSGNPELSVVEYKKARALKPDSLRIRRALAMTLCETHNLDEAIVEMVLVSQALPLDEDVKLSLHALLQQKKKLLSTTEQLLP